MYGNLALDTKRIIDEATKQGIVICGGTGEGKPEFTEGSFSLNGDATQGLDHETFFWEGLPEQPEWQTKHYANTEHKNDIFDFCKTAHKPYDAVVTAVLLRAKHHYGSLVRISSDGSWANWQEGRTLYAKTFGVEAPSPFDHTEVRYNIKK